MKNSVHSLCSLDESISFVLVLELFPPLDHRCCDVTITVSVATRLVLVMEGTLRIRASRNCCSNGQAFFPVPAINSLALLQSFSGTLLPDLNRNAAAASCIVLLASLPFSNLGHLLIWDRRVSLTWQLQEASWPRQGVVSMAHDVSRD